ncbi:unnamed protein product [Dimorphilus gyrociliatus]|uniref:Uncharacterized protein n=1 Tax=Dimorphilus gyrociliatus TaxID=2664684 RepID=A0A7I8W9Y9_9ANNE|nr:unnamed protein product [Dimorphilus gyrociliatus]
MPQVINKKAFNEHIPAGKGSTYNQLLEASWSVKKRAFKINEKALNRLDSTKKRIERHAKVLENQREKIMNRMNNSLLELNAYQEVLRDDYRAVEVTKTTRRRPELGSERNAIETRVFHSGFSISNLRRVVKRKMTEMDPLYQKNEKRRQFMDELKRKNAPKTIGKDLILPEFMQLKRRYPVLPPIADVNSDIEDVHSESSH